MENTILPCFSTFYIADYKIYKGDRIMQGIITSYAVTEDDEAKGKRNGGFGSTDGQKD